MTGALAGPCDAGVVTATRHQAPDETRWTLAACILGSSLAFIDGSVVNVALPAIGREPRRGRGGALPGSINAYLLPLGALILLGGAAGDHYGRRRLLLGGVALFALASLPAPSAPALPCCWRRAALQGVGAALLMPNSLAILGAAFTGEARGRAIGTWAAAGRWPARSGRCSAAGWSMRRLAQRSSCSICRSRAARRLAGLALRAESRDARDAGAARLGRRGAGDARARRC